MNLRKCVFFVTLIFNNNAADITSKNNVTSIMEYFVSLYGDKYGTEWIYFPDEEGISHYVSLTGDDDDYMMHPRKHYSEIEYRLFTRTRNSTLDAIVLNETAQPLAELEIDMEEFELGCLPLKVITHGWRSSAEGNAVADIRDAYIKAFDVNVITVDWSYTANSIFYHWVANQTVAIGTEIAMFLNALNERYGVTGEQVHLIGHSLGAHIMGIAAYQTNLTIDRITGLDPARPLFEYPSRNETAKLDATDACFVDVIHTCSGLLGIEGAIGTADFYPNSGIPPQPGCDSIPKILEACSHGRSYNYFAESIYYPRSFPAYQCGNWSEYLQNRCSQHGYMGEIVDRNNRGSFYLKTNAQQPFGRIDL